MHDDTLFSIFIRRILALLLASSTAACLCLAGTSPSSTPTADPLTTFDAAWSIIDETYYDTNFNGVDWREVRAELRPRAAQAKTNEELRRILQDMLDRIDQSHMMVIPQSLADKVRGEPAEGGREASGSPPVEDSLPEQSVPGQPDGAPGDVGLTARLVNNEMVVVNVEPESAADRAGVKPGWIIHSIAGDEVAASLRDVPEKSGPGDAGFIAWRLIHAQLKGNAGATVSVGFRTGDNELRTLNLTRQSPRGRTVKLGNLPEMFAYFDSSAIPLPGGGEAGLMEFNLWMIPAAKGFDLAMDRFRDADGIIIDLRGNVGGIGGMIMGISGHFFDEPVSLGTLIMRDAEINFLANPRRVDTEGRRVQPYAGPVAILIDPLSLSASELFAGGMQELGRARIFGQRSGGQALPALFDRLPNGDVLYHVVANFVTPSGKQLEGKGVAPDQPIAVDAEALLAGRDPVLEAAVRWIQESRAQSAQSIH